MYTKDEYIATFCQTMFEYCEDETLHCSSPHPSSGVERLGVEVTISVSGPELLPVTRQCKSLRNSLTEEVFFPTNNDP